MFCRPHGFLLRGSFKKLRDSDWLYRVDVVDVVDVVSIGGVYSMLLTAAIFLKKILSQWCFT